MEPTSLLNIITEFSKFGILGAGWVIAIYLFVTIVKILTDVVQGNTRAMTLLAERIEKKVSRYGNDK